MIEVIEKAIQMLKDGARRVELTSEEFVIVAYRISDTQWRIDLKKKS